MLTVADKVFEGHFTLWVYGNEGYETQVYSFLGEVIHLIEKRVESIARQINSAPMTYSHEDNFKHLEEKVWELKFVSQMVRLACVWDPKPKHLVIFYGFKKKSRKWPARELENMRVQLAKYLSEEARIGKQEENTKRAGR